MRLLITGLVLVVAVTACTPAGGEPARGPIVTVTATVTAGGPSSAPASTPPGNPTPNTSPSVSISPGTTSVSTASPPPVTDPPSKAQPHATPKPTTTQLKLGAHKVVTPDGRTCPDHPTIACTGAPPGQKLTPLPLNDGTAHRINIPGTILESVYIPGDLLITVDDVIIRNSVIDGTIFAYKDNVQKRYAIMDSTVGPPSSCNSLPGVGEGHFTAVRVYVRNHGDGFRDSGDDIVIQDSFVDLCSNPGDHSDGIQAYDGGKNVVFDHNTIDQRGVADRTAPIFFPVKQSPRSANVVMTNNLVIGGTYSIQLRGIAGHLIVKNNMMVDKTWDYLPVDADCDRADWADNKIVTVDAQYRITAVVGPLACTG